MRWAALGLQLLLLVAGAAASDGGQVGRPGSFAAPTRGRSDAITLTTFLTDAADVHYAVVLAGHAPLAAADIKTAAAKLGGEESEGARLDPGSSMATKEKDNKSEAVRAATVTVERAQKLEMVIDALQANTSYDVFVVAEVIGSNGVFGQVQSVLALKTHPEPPAIEEVQISAANATAEAVDVRISLSASGRVFIALRPNSEHSTPLTQEELSASQSLDITQQPVFTAHDVLDHPLTFNKSVIGLTPSTTYDVFLVSEAPGGGDVRSEIRYMEKAVRTHSLPPEIRKVRSSPKNGSAFDLDVSFRLEFHPEDLLRITDESLPLFNVNIRYEATAMVNGKNASSQRTISAVPSNHGQESDTAKTSATSPDTASAAVSGMVVFGNFTTLEQLHEKIAETQHITIGGLRNGTEYQVALVAETAKSNGLYGLRKLSPPAYTHQVAPVILHSLVEPTLGTVHGLTVKVNMSGNGNIHYVVTKGHVSVAHNDLLRVTSISQLLDMVEERNRACGPLRVGFVRLEDVPRVMPNGSERHRTGNYSRTFQISGLQDSTQYSLVIVPETVGSFGVFGQPYSKILDSFTYENASKVSLVSLNPVAGSTSSIVARVRMSKPTDVLYYCIEARYNNSVESSRSEQCSEANRSTFEFVHGLPNEFSFSVGSLLEDSEYSMSVYSESSLRNEVFSNRSSVLSTQTYSRPPRIQRVHSIPEDGSTATIKTDVVVDRQCLLHYVILPATDPFNQTERFEEELSNNSKILLDYSDAISTHQFGRHSRIPIVSSGCLLVSADQTTIETTGLAANTTYKIYLVTETSRDGNSSGVVSNFSVSNVTTHASAPTIVKATAAPVAGTTDSIVVAVNLSRPGIVHYFVSDADFADPAVIRASYPTSATSLGYTPHTFRGEFSVQRSDLYLEIINGTNDTGPTDPPIFVKNVSVSGLKSGVLYHVSLTTETFDSQGVFGEFPPPILVNSHPPAPRINRGLLEVGPTKGSSTSIDIALRLERFGDVHYALFFRGINTDRSDAIFAAERAEAEANRQRQRAEMKAEMIAAGTFNASNFTDDAPNLWPPLTSNFDLSLLNPLLLKAARFEELGVGVWDNGTISVSREDVLKGKMTHKTIEKLPPNAVFDVCLVSETEGGSDVFSWNSSETDCHRVTTYADYTNQSCLFDEVQVIPTPGRTDSIKVQLVISKLLNAPQKTPSVSGSVTLDSFSDSTGRIPRFILIDGKDGRREFNYNSFSSSRDIHGISLAFQAAIPGQSGVIATGVIDKIAGENDTFLTVERKIEGLKPNTPYLLFFAYETAHSGGVFTKINPHKHRPNDSRSENNGIEVETYEDPPVLSRLEVSPTHGNATSFTAKFDISCESCDRAIVHILVYPETCSAPSTSILLPTFPSNESAQKDIGVRDEGICREPLAKKRVKIAMPENQHQRKDIDEEIGGSMVPNTTYVIYLATETVNSSGVISDHFEARRARTHVLPPKFRSLKLLPRKASTTELLLQFELDGPGEVHYMLGKSDNPEFNATSALNVTSKGGGRNDRRGRGNHHHHHDEPNFHNYARDVVRMRRNFKVDRDGVDSFHTEVLDYLQPGTAYDAYVVVEAEGENGIYSLMEHFRDVSTFKNAPILLAHAANPTPATTNSLTVGFRIDGPGTIHFSVVSVAFWDPTRRVAPKSDKYGNRLAMVEQLVARDHMVIDESSMAVSVPGSCDSGWHEKSLPVPHAAANYTVYVVTETTESDGVYGIVATHQNVRSYALPPRVLRVFAVPTDARVDSLSVSVRLSDPGHVHYVAIPQGSVFAPDEDYPHRGVVDANESSCAEATPIDCAFGATFEVEELIEGTTYAIYVRAETLGSYGVFGEWQAIAATARTHGLPPAILHELDCAVNPPCEVLGRYTCTRAPNVCGDCLDGFTAAPGSVTNAPCVQMINEAKADSNPPPRTSRIKINSVIFNPLLEIEREFSSGSDEDVMPMSEPTPAPSEPTPTSSECPVNAESLPSGGCQCLPGFIVGAGGTTCVLPELPPASAAMQSDFAVESHSHRTSANSRADSTTA